MASGIEAWNMKKEHRRVPSDVLETYSITLPWSRKSHFFLRL